MWHSLWRPENQTVLVEEDRLCSERKWDRRVDVKAIQRYTEFVAARLEVFVVDIQYSPRTAICNKTAAEGGEKDSHRLWVRFSIYRWDDVPKNKIGSKIIILPWWRDTSYRTPGFPSTLAASSGPFPYFPLSGWTWSSVRSRPMSVTVTGPNT